MECPEHHVEMEEIDCADSNKKMWYCPECDMIWEE